MADAAIERTRVDSSDHLKSSHPDDTTVIHNNKKREDESLACNEDHRSLEQNVSQIQTPNGKCKSSAHHFKSPSNKKGNNGAGYLCHSGHKSHSKIHGHAQNHGNANGIFSHFLKSPLMQKRNKGVLGNSSGESSDKKMSLFNNSGGGGGLGSGSFMESKNWCGISPVCTRLRDHPDLASGAPHHIHF